MSSPSNAFAKQAAENAVNVKQVKQTNSQKKKFHKTLFSEYSSQNTLLLPLGSNHLLLF